MCILEDVAHNWTPLTANLHIWPCFGTCFLSRQTGVRQRVAVLEYTRVTTASWLPVVNEARDVRKKTSSHRQISLSTSEIAVTWDGRHRGQTRKGKPQIQFLFWFVSPFCSHATSSCISPSHADSWAPPSMDQVHVQIARVLQHDYEEVGCHIVYLLIPVLRTNELLNSQSTDQTI